MSIKPTDWLEAMRAKARANESHQACLNGRVQPRFGNAKANAKQRRRPTHEEDNLQIACRTWFDLQYPSYRMLLHHSPNEGLLVKRAADGAKRKAMGVRAGFPDFIFLLPTKVAPYLCLELKTAKGKQSDSQRAYQQLVEKAGGRYVVIRSIDEFQQAINEYISQPLWKDG